MRILRISLLAAAISLGLAHPAAAQPGAEPTLTYADMVELAEASGLVVHARIRNQVALKPERAPGLAPGQVRLYIEADTLSLIAGNVPVGERLKYLVDVPLNEKGKPPRLKKTEVLLFANPVNGRPGEIQLVGPGAHQLYDASFEQRLRPILTALVQPDAPPRVVRVADALAVQGTLVGESETQLFLETENDGPASITIVRRPTQPPRWGVSWTEIVDQSARAPSRDTLAWYRLACTLPAELPRSAILSREADTRALAMRDYAFVIEQLGACPRSL